MTIHPWLGRSFLATLLVALLCFLAACDKSAPAPSAASPAEKTPVGSLELLFTYGSEKKSWIQDATNTFNASAQKSTSGKPIFVRAVPLGSGECIDDILESRAQPHLTSPASAAFIKLGNAKSRVKGNGELVPKTQNLVLSPVVIAMWKPMAQAIGWGQKPVGWEEILALTRSPKGWASAGHAEWGAFRFGHTHPEYSNSGLISVIAEMYAATGKTRDLTPDDLADPKVAAFVNDIEKAVVHYGSSTGFFGDKLIANGPQYLSAAVLYESVVIESYAKNVDPPIVAIYPKEGTFWSDHPVGVVNRPWVTPEHQAAAKVYIDYLLARPQQEAALRYGFRPADPAIGFSAPLDEAHGVDPRQPSTLLEVPSADVIEKAIALWRDNKKHAEVVLVFDTSGSMNGERITNAKAGARQFITMLAEEDHLNILPFSDEFHWVAKDLPIKTMRRNAGEIVDGFIANGNTRLFDSIAEGQKYLAAKTNSGRIAAVVVLTDGEDNRSTQTLDGLLQLIRTDSERPSIRVFTIGYGSEAKKDQLKKIADQTQAKFFEGTPENIREVFKEIATFF